MRIFIISAVIMMSLATTVGMTLSFAPGFGRAPGGAHQTLLARSPNFYDGQFHNALPTPMLTGDKSRTRLLLEMLFRAKEGLRPDSPLPYFPTDLRTLDPRQEIIVWLGHSSWYLQMGGKRILIDPVFSDYAAPFSFVNKAFSRALPWQAETMPEIDTLIISHDHYDHLDYATIKALLPKIRQALVPLGVGSHLRHWGMAPARIIESDWHQSWPLSDTLNVHVLPARHFSGRGLKSNQTLWASFLFATPDSKIYYSGDSGYGPHFQEIGQRFGAIDIAIMENGQYDPSWKHIHMMPEEAAQGASDLNARAVIPGHAGRFVLANHEWNDPWRRLVAAAAEKPWTLLTPQMGEVVQTDHQQPFTAWWQK
jgi:L-ascorbate metabolism protein UlaG (beta-lactamase superfamily)